MAVTRMTTPLKAGDGRLKVLWLDDTIDRIAPWTGAALDFEPWFSLVYATHPDDIRQLIEDSVARSARTDGGRPLYDLESAPFDAYLVDFRLCDKIDDGCTLEAHLEAGLHAPSAGLLVGILAALRWPDHPQALIPYSGYDEEFGQIWRLTQQFCPPAISVLWDDSVTKGTRDQNSLLRLLPLQFRKALASAAQSTEVVMPLKERDRWETLLGDGSDETVDADERVWLSTAHGVRPFLVGALFHDMLDGVKSEVPAAGIREWISTLPVTDPMERQARRLADFYWKLKCNEVSRDVYSIVRTLRQGTKVADLPPNPPSYPWLCSWKRKGDAHLSVQRIRLAVLFLYLRQHEDRVVRRRQQADIPEEVKNLLLVMREDNRSVEELLEDLENAARLDGCLDRYHELIGNFLEFVESGAVIDPIRNVIADRDLDVDEGDIVRLVDPFPAAWDAPLTLDESMKVGKGLTRLDMEDVPSLDVKTLLTGDASSLTPAELLCARRFARELMPSKEDWPGWLRSAEQGSSA